MVVAPGDRVEVIHDSNPQRRMAATQDCLASISTILGRAVNLAESAGLFRRRPGRIHAEATAAALGSLRNPGRRLTAPSA
jgi:hypothetical protein